MKILATNKKYLLVSSNDKQVYLMELQSLRILYLKQFSLKANIKIGALQYGTGLACFAIGSIVYIYDFILSRQRYSLDTYKQILQLYYIKNLLLIISEDRILIHNLESKQNLNYISTVNGKQVFIQQDYYNLKVFYPENKLKLITKSIWQQKNNVISGVIYHQGCFINKFTVLTIQNVLSFYQDTQLVKVYGFDHKIIQVLKANQDIVLVLLQYGQVVGQNLTSQFQYQFQPIFQHQFTQIQLIQTNMAQSYLFLWICKQNIFLWHKQVNEKGILFQASLNKAKIRIMSEKDNQVVQTKAKQNNKQIARQSINNIEDQVKIQISNKQEQ